jgi:Bacterial regulatory protein, Fis family
MLVICRFDNYDTTNPPGLLIARLFLQLIYIFYTYLPLGDDIYVASNHSCLGHSVMRKIGDFYRAVKDYEKQLISQALMQSHGNQAKAARILGLTPTTLSSQLRRLGIDARAFKRDSVAIPFETFEKLWHWRSRGS